MLTTGLHGIANLFKPIRIHREQAPQISASLAAIAHAMASIEHLSNGKNRTKGGTNYWEITRDATRFKNPVWKAVLDFASRPSVTNTIYPTYQ